MKDNPFEKLSRAFNLASDIMLSKLEEQGNDTPVEEIKVVLSLYNVYSMAKARDNQSEELRNKEKWRQIEHDAIENPKDYCPNITIITNADLH